ncbi:MAG: hypothetical protein P8X53_09960 [Chromatiales bacterium]
MAPGTVEIAPPSVCGGVKPDVGESYRGTINLVVLHFDRVVKVDTTGRRATAQAGIPRPDLEAAWPESATQSPQLSFFDPGRMEREAAEIHGAMHRPMQSRVEVSGSRSGVWCRSLLQSSAF